MRFVATQHALAAAVRLLKAHVPRRSALPVLAGVRVTPTQDSTLILEGTDLESGAQLEIGASDIEGPGEVLKLADLATAAGLKGKGDFVSYLDGTARVGDTSLRIERFDADDYPALPEMPDHWLEGDIEGLCEAIALVSVACSGDQARPILTGVNIEPGLEPGEVAVVATDSYRMAWQTVKANNLPVKTFGADKGKPKSLLVPGRKAAGAIAPQVIAADDRHVFFGNPQVVSFVRTIDGAFPKWRSLIKTDKPTGTWEVMGDDLASTLKTTPKEADTIPIKIDFHRNEITMTHNGGVAWSAPIPGTKSQRLDDTVVAVNARYLADAAKVCSGNITISVVDALKPIRMVGANGASYLQMPVRI